MAEDSPRTREFSLHALKAELFDEVVKVVNGIFEERETRVGDLERRAIEGSQLSEKKLNDSVNQLNEELSRKVALVQESVLQLTVRVDTTEQQSRLVKGSMDVLSTLVQGQSAKLEGEFNQIRELSKKQEEQFERVHQRLLKTLHNEEEKWSGWHQQLTRTTTTHQRLIDDAIAGQRLLEEKLNAQSERLLLAEKLSNQTRTTLANYDREVSKLTDVQRSLEKAHLLIVDNTSKLKELQNFIEKYEPIYTYAQVSDVLFAVVDDKLRRKLQEIDRKTFAEFSVTTSIDRGIPNLRRKVLTSTQTINRIMLRNKPYEKIEASLEEEVVQNYYEEKLQREITQLKNMLEGELKDMQKLVVGRMDETIKQVVLELSESNEATAFRIEKAEDRIESLVVELRKCREDLKQVNKEGIFEDSYRKDEPQRKAGTALDSPSFNLKLDLLSRRLRQSSRVYRRKETNDGSFTQRYEGVHRNNVNGQAGNSSYLIPENMMEMRRKSLIDMRRTKITAPNIDAKP